jgi:hypothetical protein
LEVIADFYHGGGDVPAAIDALRSAPTDQPNAGRLRHKPADYSLQIGSPDLAASSYRRAFDTGYRSMWTLLNLIENAISDEDSERGRYSSIIAATQLANRKKFGSSPAIWALSATTSSKGANGYKISV